MCVQVGSRTFRSIVAVALSAFTMTCGDSQAPGEPPVLAISAAAISFSGVELGGDPPSQSFTIGNAGGGTLSWSVSGDAPWLTATPASGSGTAAVMLSVSTAGLAAGSHAASLTIRSDDATNSPRTVAVDLDLTPAPEIALAPATVSFTGARGGSNPPAQTIDVSNSGGASLNWTASTTTSWLSVSPTSGTAPSTITVAVDMAQHPVAGAFTGRFTIAAAGAKNTPQVMEVPLTVTEPPQLGVSPTSNFLSLVPGDTAQRPVFITNVGGGTLNWTASSNVAWIELSQASGTAPDTLDLTVKTDGLEPGTYDGAITIAASGANDSPQQVSVSLAVLGPVLSVSHSFMFFSLESFESSAKTADISNIGGGALSWTASNRASWLQLDPVSGTAPSTLSVTVSAADLPTGSYKDTIIVTAAGALGSPDSIEVTLSVLETRLHVSGLPFVAGSVQLSLVPDQTFIDTLTVSLVSGTRTLDWTASNSLSWVTVSPASGMTPDTALLTMQTAGLAEGNYYDTLVVAADGAANSPIRIPVSINVRAPFMSVSPGIRDITVVQGGTNPDPFTVLVSNFGNGTVDWTASTSTPWLSISPASGTATNASQSTATASINTAGLDIGTHWDSIVFSAPSVPNSPRKTHVFVRVETPPVIAVLDTPVVFYRHAGNTASITKFFRVQNTGGGTLEWSATDDADWLSLSPTAGTVTTNSNVFVGATANAAGQGLGAYPAIVTLASTNAGNQPPQVRAELNVVPERDYDGTWVGVGGDTTLTFEIAGNKITNISFGERFIPNACGGASARSPAVSSSVGIDVANSDFFTTQPHSDPSFGHISYTLSGVFSSDTAVAGTLTVRYSIFPCGGSITVNWTGAKQ